VGEGNRGDTGQADSVADHGRGVGLTDGGRSPAWKVPSKAKDNWGPPGRYRIVRKPLVRDLG